MKEITITVFKHKSDAFKYSDLFSGWNNLVNDLDPQYSLSFFLKKKRHATTDTIPLLNYKNKRPHAHIASYSHKRLHYNNSFLFTLLNYDKIKIRHIGFLFDDENIKYL